MCIVVRLLDEGWESSNEMTHVTVGTAAPEIKPKESNELLQKWLEQGVGGESGIREVEVSGHVELVGSVKAVMQGQGR